MDRYTPRFTIGPWTKAATETAGETLFVVGDVHGCTPLLQTILDGVADLAAVVAGSTRLVFLGDIIDRGPDSIGSLRLWASAQPAPGISHVERLMGNHEQLLLLANGTGPETDLASSVWLATSGDTMLAEMRAIVGKPDAVPGPTLIDSALGADIVARLGSLRTHLLVGNLVLVHGGIDPRQPLSKFLALPWQTLAVRPCHWAWIVGGFLDWHDGFGGRIVVHGHTPPAKQRPFTGLADPHVLVEDRLNLDGGSAVTGIVAGAQIETGRYRIIRAVSAGADACG
jgi:serine/threonine protein phosphatase 1